MKIKRILNIILVIFISILLVSCNTEEKLTEEEKLEALKEELFKEQQLLYAYEDDEIDQATLYSKYDRGQSSFVGYGINVLCGSSYSDGLKPCLLDKSAYGTKSESSKIIYSDRLTDYKATLSLSNNLAEAYTNLNVCASLGTGAAVPFFSGSVSAQYEQSTKISSNARFYNSIESYVLNKQYLSVDYATAQQLTDKKIIKASVLKYINDPDMPINALFGILGTHLITDAGMGGSYNITALYNSSSKVSDMDIKASLKFDSNYISGQADTHFKEKYSQVFNNTTIKVSARGGNTNLINLSKDIDVLGASLSKWRESIDYNPTLAYIYGAIPLWEFATNETRKNEIRTAYYDLANNIKNGLDMSTFFGGTQKENLIVDGGIYILKTYYANKSIQFITPISEEDSDRAIHLWEYTYDKKNLNQQWYFELVPGYLDIYTIRNIKNGLYLKSGNYYYDRSVETWEDTGTKDTMFLVIEHSDGSITLRSMDNVCYTVQFQGSSAKNGTIVVLELDNPSDKAQSWIPIKVE